MISISKKLKVFIGTMILLLVMIVGISAYYLTSYKVDFNKQLPIVMTTEYDQQDFETIAYEFWMELMDVYTSEEISSWKRVSDVRYEKFQLLAGDENDFAVGVTFSAKLAKKNRSIHNNWGKVQRDGTVEDIQWTLRIKKIGEHTYSLEQVEETTDAIAGLPPVKDTYQKEAGLKVPDANNRYEIINGKLKVTYNNGDNWIAVPTTLDELFVGDYSGSQNELIEGSYVISEERTAFIIGEALVNRNGGYLDQIKLLQTVDAGKTWKEYDITNSPSIRARYLGFTSEKDGYLIMSADRTMGFEANAIYTTNDGGESWKQAGIVEQTNRHITGGGFTNKQLGFISFGAERENGGVEHPSLYRTSDGGQSWEEVTIPIPAEYAGIFTIAEIPALDGTQGALLVNQGPNGDYKGGKVLARFTTLDEGVTWFFSNLVDPDNSID